MHKTIRRVLSRCSLIGAVVVVVAACTSGDAKVDPEGQAPDPVVVDFPIAYVKRPIPTEDDGNGNSVIATEVLREPVAFNPGAELFIRDRASSSAAETNITEGVFADGELYDVKDLEVSFDGNKLIFAMRAPEIPDADEDEQPTWNIWEYDRQTQTLRRIITSDITAEAGDDISPHYLPDGRIVFSSNRQRTSRAILLDEGKPQYAALDEDRNVETFNLHVMDEDGSNLTQITFNQSHDLEPSVLSNGRIVFSRWDHAAGNDAISLYQINPDGSDLQMLYGVHSHDTGSDGSIIEFMEPRETPDGRILSKLKPPTSQRFGGELVYIDWQNFTEIDQPVASNSGQTGPAQVSATPGEVRTDDLPSPGGRYASFYPLFDGTGRLLTSWSNCRLEEVDANQNTQIVPCTEERLSAANPVEAAPLYGLWILDPAAGTQLPILPPEEGMIFHEIVAMAPRPLPDVITDTAITGDQDLITENVGVIHIRSVYDLDGTDISPAGITAMADPMQVSAAQRPIRFLRLVKPVSLPDDDVLDIPNTAFGRGGGNGMREILGYVPVEPDGSVAFKAPANVAFSIELLDSNGFRVSERHNNWLSVRPGEVKQCNGCHTRNSELPHGRLDAEAPSINPGAPVTGSPFPNTNPAFFADEGETMAEVRARLQGYVTPSVDILFTDDWTDPNLRTPDMDIVKSYNDLTTPAPTTLACLSNWSALCRITINYVDHIQPIWDLPRQVFDGMGNLLEDRTCISCHSNSDAMGQVQLPAGQLELVGVPSTDEPDHLVSYRELMFPDAEQEIVNGALIDRLVQATDANGNPLFEVDENGNLILDANGNPIPVMVTVNVPPALNANAAIFNQSFFARFQAGGAHAGWLSEAELKLIAEWLDIGAQYYNNPFAVPQ